MAFFFRVGLVAFLGLIVSLQSLAPTHTVAPSPQNHVLSGNELYYEGQPRKAIEAYAQAIKADARSLNARLNGATILNELGEMEVAAIWYREAVRLSPRDPEARIALAETLLHLGKIEDARAEAKTVLDTHPEHPYGLITLGRIELAAGDPRAALPPLEKAVEVKPNFTLANYYLGRAREKTGDDNGALEAYQIATYKDSYFSSARYRLSQTLSRLKRFREAYEQVGKLVNTAPAHTGYRKLARALKRRIHRSRPSAPSPRTTVRKKKASTPPSHTPLATQGRIPVLRVGIGTDGLGKPIPWYGFHFTSPKPFRILSAHSGGVLAWGKAGRRWRITVTPKGYIEVYNSSERRMIRTRAAIRIRPNMHGWTYIHEMPSSMKGESARLARTLRGDIEISRFPKRSSLQIVNVVDLESYTQGVLTAEMPIRSPAEALKAQAVIARTHALFVKDVRPRHKQHGYQICDGQHCQVYYGVGSETPRSREVVANTRGRIVTHRGRIAEMLYSSNCGGHSQSSGDLEGWSEVPYFTGVRDVDGSIETPSSPWALRLWLRSSPKTFCSPSSYVYSSHYRWSRIVPAKELERRINRTLHIGKLHSILPLKRSSSGHLNSILVTGSRGSRLIHSEIRIRGLFGVGSQRSALFIMETDRDKMGKPLNYVFYGGGWGHGVGMCQSGAMGRAERGQSYAKILKSYYKGVEIGNLRY